MSLSLSVVPPGGFEWMRDRSGYAAGPETRGIQATDSAGRVVGMLAFDTWTPNGVFAHVATSAPIAWRKLLSVGFDYAFNQAGKGVVMGQLRAGNLLALRTAQSAGLREVARIPDGWAPGEDLVLLQARKADWLKEGRAA